MASYQDFEQRIQILERRLEFVMKSFQFNTQGPLVGQVKTVNLLDLYHMANQPAGLAPLVSEESNGTAPSAAE